MRLFVKQPLAIGGGPGDPGGMTQTLRIATWNINSLRLRLALLGDLVAGLDPDVICLQETKVPDELFPHETLADIGYPHFLFAGMKGYNGVAILSRYPLRRITDMPDWCGRGDCRHIAAEVEMPSGSVAVHNFYVPAGGDVPDRELNPKFGHKLDFIAEAQAWFAANPPRRSVLVGDLNIAPLVNDVWNHKQLLGVVSHTPVGCWRGSARGSWMLCGISCRRVRSFILGGLIATGIGRWPIVGGGWIMCGSRRIWSRRAMRCW